MVTGEVLFDSPICVHFTAPISSKGLDTTLLVHPSPMALFPALTSSLASEPRMLISKRLRPCSLMALALPSNPRIGRARCLRVGPSRISSQFVLLVGHRVEAVEGTRRETDGFVGTRGTPCEVISSNDEATSASVSDRKGLAQNMQYAPTARLLPRSRTRHTYPLHPATSVLHKFTRLST